MAAEAFGEGRQPRSFRSSAMAGSPKKRNLESKFASARQPGLRDYFFFNAFSFQPVLNGLPCSQIEDHAHMRHAR
jgi:hypothetical protein